MKHLISLALLLTSCTQSTRYNASEDLQNKVQTYSENYGYSVNFLYFTADQNGDNTVDKDESNSLESMMKNSR